MSGAGRLRPPDASRATSIPIPIPVRRSCLLAARHRPPAGNNFAFPRASPRSLSPRPGGCARVSSSSSSSAVLAMVFPARGRAARRERLRAAVLPLASRHDGVPTGTAPGSELVGMCRAGPGGRQSPSLPGSRRSAAPPRPRPRPHRGDATEPRPAGAGAAFVCAGAALRLAPRPGRVPLPLIYLLSSFFSLPFFPQPLPLLLFFPSPPLLSSSMTNLLLEVKESSLFFFFSLLEGLDA